MVEVFAMYLLVANTPIVAEKLVDDVEDMDGKPVPMMRSMTANALHD